MARYKERQEIGFVLHLSKASNALIVQTCSKSGTKRNKHPLHCSVLTVCGADVTHGKASRSVGKYVRLEQVLETRVVGVSFLQSRMGGWFTVLLLAKENLGKLKKDLQRKYATSTDVWRNQKFHVTVAYGKRPSYFYRLIGTTVRFIAYSVSSRNVMIKL